MCNSRKAVFSCEQSQQRFFRKYHLFIETSSPRVSGDTAILESPCLDLTGVSAAELTLWYHMYGASIDTLDVQVASSTGDSCGSLGSYASAWSLSGDQGDTWYEAIVDLGSYVGGSIQIHILGIRGSSYTGDIAIDDVLVTGTAAGGVCGDSTVDAGEDCDDGNTLPGDCCSATCQYESAATVCRAAAGVCDAADYCDGAGTCDADAKLTSECRASAGACDVAEVCDGVADDCPADAFEPATMECRAAAGDCDVAETCTGAAPSCPADAFEPPATACGDPGDTVCDDPDSCDAVGNCQANYEPPTTLCRAAVGECDAPDNCDGASAACPADAKLTTECRPSVHVCDAAEFCDGVSDECGRDLPRNGLSCADGDLCNGNEVCVSWTCTAGAPPVCDDDDMCTVDSCDALLGCINDGSKSVERPATCDRPDLPSASPAGRALLSLLVVGAGAMFLARRRRFGA